MGYDRGIFYSASDFDWLGLGGFDLIYRAYENLVHFYNSLVLGAAGVSPMPGHYRDPQFYATYRSLYEGNPGLSPREMPEGGLRAMGLPEPARPG